MKALTFSFAILFAFLVTIVSVSAADGFAVTEPDKLRAAIDDSGETTFNINNTGTTALSSFDLKPFDKANFSDGDEDITISLLNVPPSLASGDNADVTIKADIPDDIELGKYNGLVNVTSGTASASFTLTIEAKPELCEDGNQGDNLRIVDVKEPDTGDKFYPGEEIEVEVRVKNNEDDDLDIVIEVFLYDRKDSEELDSAKLETNIDDEEKEDYELKLNVPYDIKEDDDRYSVYAMVYDEDDDEDECRESWDSRDRIDIEIKKNKHDVKVDSIELPETAPCGSIIEATVKLVNAGKNDEDDVTVRLKVPELAIDESSSELDIEEGEDEKVTLVFLVPRDVEAGDYTLNLEVRDEDGDVYDEDGATLQTILKVGDSCIVPPSALSASLTLPTTSFSAQQGKAFSVTVVIENTGESDGMFSVVSSPLGDWAEVASLLASVNAGESQTYTLSLTPKASAADGSYNAEINLLADSEKLDSKAITVSVSRPTTGITGGVIGQPWYTQKGNLPLLAINAVLIVAIIVLIVWIISLRSSEVAVVNATSANIGRRTARASKK